jgi:cyclopropane fatty-acyl-phospholipid synthase-like methyltransferase
MTYGKKTTLDQSFVESNLMGPNCLRLIEELTAEIKLPETPRILDLGCGTGLTSIFLATEFNAQVFAADLWISPSENYERFVQTGCDKSIIPIHAEAHALPFAHHYFDAIVSVDSYHYFGADPAYLDTHLVPLVKPGGVIAVSVPGLQPGLTEASLPDAMKDFWNHEVINFNSLEWWEELWAESPHIIPIKTFSHSCHKQAWDEWLATDNPYAKHDVDMMKAENGSYFDSLALIFVPGT